MVKTMKTRPSGNVPWHSSYSTVQQWRDWSYTEQIWVWMCLTVWIWCRSVLEKTACRLSKVVKSFYSFSPSLIHDPTFFKKMQWQSPHHLILPTLSPSYCCLESAPLSIHWSSTYDSLFLVLCVYVCVPAHVSILYMYASMCMCETLLLTFGVPTKI